MDPGYRLPNDPSDTASFDISNLKGVSLSETAEVNSVVFSSQSSPFTVTCPPLVQLMVSGAGIVNNSASSQNFVAQTIDGQFGSGAFDFLNNASAGTGKTAIVISKTSSIPISGTFANLPDGGTISSGTNTFQANYEGGNGNDLTLTVVP